VELVKLAGESNGNRSTRKADLVSASLSLDPTMLAQRYLDSLRPAISQSALFTDKMPLNFLYIGLICRAFPNARIVHIKRTPLDACYAIYKTYFQQTYPYSYDLTDIGRYYIAYRKLMAHWEQIFPGRIIHISYEGLVAQQETASRQLLSDCGLAWQDACLSFHDNPNPTATASSVQVRAGIYSSSVGRWKFYENELAPLCTLLKSAGLNPYEWP